ncbi:MAG: hypothetical protein J7M14_03900, partial [Planctomycetes bacterium]|nr:hypothetical protein [Planctomycetota bacterium]
PADDSLKPTSTVLASAVVSESSLAGGYQWVTVNMTGLDDLDPTLGYCVVISDLSGESGLARVEYERRDHPMPDDTHLMTSSNRGGSWTNPEGMKDMRFSIEGTVTTQGSPEGP